MHLPLYTKNSRRTDTEESSDSDCPWGGTLGGRGKGERETLLFRNFWISNQVQIDQNKQKQLTMLVEPLAQEQMVSKTWWFSWQSWKLHRVEQSPQLTDRSTHIANPSPWEELWNQTDLGWTQPLPLIDCVTVDMPLNLPVPQSPPLSNGNNGSTGLCWTALGLKWHKSHGADNLGQGKHSVNVRLCFHYQPTEKLAQDIKQFTKDEIWIVDKHDESH